jgi:hypothetical protein
MTLILLLLLLFLVLLLCRCCWDLVAALLRMLRLTTGGVTAKTRLLVLKWKDQIWQDSTAEHHPTYASGILLFKSDSGTILVMTIVIVHVSPPRLF